MGATRVQPAGDAHPHGVAAQFDRFDCVHPSVVASEPTPRGDRVEQRKRIPNKSGKRIPKGVARRDRTRRATAYADLEGGAAGSYPRVDVDSLPLTKVRPVGRAELDGAEQATLGGGDCGGGDGGGEGGGSDGGGEGDGDDGGSDGGRQLRLECVMRALSVWPLWAGLAILTVGLISFSRSRLSIAAPPLPTSTSSPSGPPSHYPLPHSLSTPLPSIPPSLLPSSPSPSPNSLSTPLPLIPPSLLPSSPPLLSHYEWCRTYQTGATTGTGTKGMADTLQASRGPDAPQGYADNQWVEVTHYFEKETLSPWAARWLSHTPGSGLWFDLGKTLIVETHAALNAVWGVNCPCTLFGYDNCVKKKRICLSDECSTVAPLAITRAVADGYDSVQILRHWMDSVCTGLPKYEILDLRQPYEPEPPEGTVMTGYYASDGSPCIKMRLDYDRCPLGWGHYENPHAPAALRVEHKWLACRV